MFTMVSYYKAEQRRLRQRASFICPNTTKKTLISAAVLALVIATLFVAVASAETTMYVVCKPESEVSIRNEDSENSSREGRLSLGDAVVVDKTSSDGKWFHCIGLGIEAGDGWVSAQYLTYEPVVIETFSGEIDSKGRVAVRKSPGGKRTDWLNSGSLVTVYAIAGEWAVTDRGYIMAEYIRGV